MENDKARFNGETLGELTRNNDINGDSLYPNTVKSHPLRSLLQHSYAAQTAAVNEMLHAYNI